MKTEYIAVIEIAGEVHMSTPLPLQSAKGWIAENRVILGELHPGQAWEIYITTFGSPKENGKNQ